MSPQTSAYTPKMNKCVIIFTKYSYIKELRYLDHTGRKFIHSFIHSSSLFKLNSECHSNSKEISSQSQLAKPFNENMDLNSLTYSADSHNLIIKIS